MGDYRTARDTWFGPPRTAGAPNRWFSKAEADAGGHWFWAPRQSTGKGPGPTDTDGVMVRFQDPFKTPKVSKDAT